MQATRRAVLESAIAMSVRAVLGGSTAVALTSCGGGGDSSSASASSTSQPPPSTVQLAIESASTTTPTALTPFTLTATGLDTAQPYAINLAVNGGQPFAWQALSTQTDGSIVMALPPNLNGDGTTSSFTASVSLSQGSSASAPITLQVSDIPPLSSYGTTLGQISRAFYNYLAISHVRVVNQLQAIAVNHPTVDTNDVQNYAGSIAKNALLARNDIDRITLNNALQIPAGNLADGTPIYMTSHAVELQDRLFGFYLNTLQGSMSAAGIGSAVHRQQQPRTGRKPVSQGSLMNGIIGGGISGTLQVASAINTAAKPASATTNSWTQVLDTDAAICATLTKWMSITALGAAATGAEPVAAGAGAAALITGVAGGTMALTSDVIKTYLAQDQLISLQQNGADQQALNDAQAAQDAAYVTTVNDGLGLVLSALPGLSTGTGTVGDVINSSAVAQGLYQGAAFAQSVIGLTAEQIGNYLASTTNAGGQLNAVASNEQQGFGDLLGTVNITDSAGNSTLDGLYQTDVVIPDGAGNNVILNGFTDGNGAYDVLVPLGNPNLQYAATTVEFQNPNGPAQSLGYELVNLSQLNSSSPTTAPTVSGQCTDDDANSSDGDDPDCGD